MFLSSVFSKKAKERYVGLFLKNEEVIGFIFEPTSTGMLTLAQDRRPFSNGWENVVEDIDDLLIKLEGETKNKARQAIFFVYSYFIDEKTGEIKPPYKEVVKNILKHLDLKALGYIECFEAVSSYIERRDSRPLNAVLVELDNTHVDVCIYKAGKRIFTKCTSRTDNVLDDVSTILTEIKGEVLPSRVIIYDSDNVHSNAGNLLEHKWETDLFVQLPRIEIIQEEQLHQELSTIFGQQLLQTTNPVETHVAVSTVPEEKTHEPVFTKDEAKIEEKPSQVMGFAIDREVTESEYENNEVANSVSTDSFTPSPMKKNNFKFSLPSFSGFMPKKNAAFRYAWVIGVLLIGISLFLVEYYLHTATLTVFLPSQPITKQLKEKIDLANETGSGIDIKQSTYSATFEQSKSTSGEREVGEKARGEVTIYNYDNSKRVITKGTVLEADGKKFILDQEVEVASASEKLAGNKEAGKKNATVIADQIGPESNLTKGKKFKVGELPLDDYYALNDSAFSGGTKKQMQTVSKKDIDALKAELLAKAKEESIATIKKNTSANEKILDSLTEVKLGDFTLSKELGEEAKEVTIQAKVNTSYYFYDTDQIKNYISDSIKTDVPDNYHLVASKVDYNMSDVKKDGDVLGVQIDINALSVKDAQQEDLIKKVKGKPKSELKSILDKEVNATGYTIDIKSPIPLLDNLMPLFQKNIHVETTASQ